MTAELVPLAERTAPARLKADIVEMLEYWLDRAKKGELTGIALAATSPDNRSMSQISAFENYSALLGGITRLQHHMFMESELSEFIE